MTNKRRQLALLVTSFICFILPGNSQIMIEDFESASLANWQVIKDTAEITSSTVYNGTYSLRMHRPDIGDAESLIIHNSFQGNNGSYQYYCLADGPVSDIDFLFQYIDASNYYRVSYKPLTTDNPELVLIRRLDGVDQVIDQVPPKFGLDVWLDMRIDRFCSGEIMVYVNDALELSIIDRSHTQPGTIGLSAWTSSSYFDDISFTPMNSTVVTDLSETICSGDFFPVGNNRYSESGIFSDTLLSSTGCDSIVNLELAVSPHFLVTEVDTICRGQFYLLGTDSLTESGRFSQSLTSQFGCDSIVELSLTVTDQLFTLLSDTFCLGESYLFHRDTILTPGTYTQTWTTADGCDSLVQLNLEQIQPSLDIGQDIEWCFREDPSLMFTVNDLDTYLWPDGSNEPNIEITEPGLLWLESTVQGCIVRDTINIINKCSLQIYVPNAFSPNGDGINDLLLPQSNSPPTNFRMQIFNRWGGKVFETENFNLGWDGNADDAELAPDVFLWVIEADDQVLSGDVLLVR